LVKIIKRLGGKGIMITSATPDVPEPAILNDLLIHKNPDYSYRTGPGGTPLRIIHNLRILDNVNLNEAF
jgi:hypothetical protein|tara:strand:- start:5309 stop:5515 length:207 start_codon:yes stop_codon:yes gene_type:complete